MSFKNKELKIQLDNVVNHQTHTFYSPHYKETSFFHQEKQQNLKRQFSFKHLPTNQNYIRILQPEFQQSISYISKTNQVGQQNFIQTFNRFANTTQRSSTIKQFHSKGRDYNFSEKVELQKKMNFAIAKLAELKNSLNFRIKEKQQILKSKREKRIKQK